MKKILLSLIAVLVSLASANAQDKVEFYFGPATWNIEDGRVFKDMEELNAEGVVLTYEYPEEDYLITQFQPVTLDYDLYIDGAEEPIKKTATAARQTTKITFTDEYIEGHSYKIVTHGVILVQINLATHTADTLVTDDKSYSISFSIEGPELVKTIDVEGTMSLYIVDQEWTPTVSGIDTKSICEALDVNSIEECKVYGLNVNGSYNDKFGPQGYDGWRDADGEFTNWGGGYDSGHGRNAYPAVYCIKLNETCDTVKYYFYDYWTEHVPEDSVAPGGGAIITQVKHRAPETHYQSMVWDWTEEDGTIIQYDRKWRCEEGKDYKASFAYVANKKIVIVNATMHFVSIKDYENYVINTTYDGHIAMSTAMMSAQDVSIAKSDEAQSVTFIETGEEGKVKISFPGFTFPMPPFPTGAFEVLADVTLEGDGSETYEADFSITINGMSIYKGVLYGTKAPGASPVIILTLQNATMNTCVFAATPEEAKAALADALTSISSSNADSATPVATYSVNGIRQNNANGINVVKYADGSVKKIMK